MENCFLWHEERIFFILSNSVPAQFHNGISSKTFLSIFLSGVRTWNGWQRIHIISVWKIISFHFCNFFSFFSSFTKWWISSIVDALKNGIFLMGFYHFRTSTASFQLSGKFYMFAAEGAHTRLQIKHIVDRTNDKIIKKEIFKSTLETEKLTNALVQRHLSRKQV